MTTLTTAAVCDACRALDICAPHVTFMPIAAQTQPITGRARTLGLRSTLPGEGKRGLDAALETYKFMNSGDFIVVARGDRPGLAYFGQVHAALARRAGVVGCAIDGYTRDLHPLPTWAWGRTPSCNSGWASVESIDQTVNFAGHLVRAGQLVVADWDGIAFVDPDLENEIVRLASSYVERDERAEHLVWSGWDPAQIAREVGKI